METLKNNYIPSLIKIAKQNLAKEFNVADFNFKDFEYVNAHLIFQSIERNLNTLITIPDKNIRLSFYIPTILILSLESFFKNYIEDDTKYTVGDIVEDKEGRRFKITQIKDGVYYLTSSDRHKTKITIFGDIKNYTITTADLSKVKVKSFDSYKAFFDSIFKVGDKLPSKFKYKSIIVTSKEIINKIKKFKFNSKYIHKAFPFQYVTKLGKKQDNIPIDAMIYIVNEYETAKEFILNDADKKIDSVIFIGASKYRDYTSSLSSDLRNKKFKNCILIGSENTDGLPDLIKWNWTIPEFNYLNHKEIFSINNIVVESTILSSQIKEFDQLIESSEEKHGINLKELYNFIRKAISIVIPSNESRLNNQIETLQHCFERDAHEVLRNEFYEIGEYDYEDIWENIKQEYKLILNSIKIDRLKTDELKKFKGIDYLVVPSGYKETWSEEILHMGFKSAKIISYDEYLNLQEPVSKQICFLAFYGYKHLESILNVHHQIHILLYKEEEKLFEKHYRKYENAVLNEIKSESRKLLSKVEFKEKTKIEQISDLIERLYTQESKDPLKPDKTFIESESILYELIFENNEVKELVFRFIKTFTTSM